MIPFVKFSQVSALLLLPINPPPIANLDGTGLKIQWDIKRTRGSTVDQGTISVYNLSPTTRKLIHESWKALSTNTGYPVEFSLGWEGLAERVMVGDCWKLTPEIRQGEDIITKFEIGDGNKQVRDATIGQNFSSLTVNVILQFLVNTVLKVPLDPISQALIVAKASELPVTIWNNYVLNGDPQDRLDELIDLLGLEWKIFNGVFIVTDKGNAATSFPLAFVLNIASGLINWKQIDDGAIEVVALANPNVRPGNQIIVQDSFGIPVGAPAHRVESIQYTGTTDGESVMSIVARKIVPL